MSSHGVRAKVPLIRVRAEDLLPDQRVIAILSCKRGSHYLGLLLKHHSGDPSLPLYTVDRAPAVTDIQGVASAGYGRIIYVPEPADVVVWPFESHTPEKPAITGELAA